MSPYVSYFFLGFVTQIQGTVLYTEKIICLFPSRKKKEKSKKKRYYDIKSNCCVIFTRSSTCVYRHIKNNKDRSILSVK